MLDTTSLHLLKRLKIFKHLIPWFYCPRKINSKKFK